MKRILLSIILLLSAISVGYCEEHVSSALTPQAKGETRAQQDIKEGKMKILYYGKPWSAGKPLLDDESGLPVEIVTNCVVTPEFVAETDAYNNLMRKAVKVNQVKTQPLQLSIKSDKQVYGAGEDIIIHASLENILDKTVAVNQADYLDWNDTSRFFFKNEEGAECKLTYIGPVDIIITDHLQSKQLWEFGSYTIGLLKDKEFKWQAFKFEQVKGKDYSFIGKQTIYMKDYGLTSNTITIEVKKEWHTSPDKWSEARIFHSEFNSEFEHRIIISYETLNIDLMNKSFSPNKAYWFTVDEPERMKNGPWNTTFHIYNERDYLIKIGIKDLDQAKARWVNEKLLYIEVWWGRVLGTYFIFDVENEKVIIKEMFHDGQIPFEQFQQSKIRLNQKH